ncbi:putative OPA3-like protein CG13603 [Cloeon dipterum]|uniref:putative OPA3-like protein CG13603 n=1 Tax=Cloeon dipterum TaxID=197152 RepID=UPI00321F7D73
MAIGAFPAFKLGALLLKQLSKPLANFVKARAKNSYFFRTYICMPPAQIYNWCEVKAKMWSMNLGSSGASVPRLNETMAIELGANLLGESIIFVTAAGILIFEYARSSRKDQEKQQRLQDHLSQMHAEITDLYFLTEQQKAQISELHRALAAAQCGPIRRALMPFQSHHEQQEQEQPQPNPSGRLVTAVSQIQLKLGPNR